MRLDLPVKTLFSGLRVKRMSPMSELHRGAVSELRVQPCGAPGLWACRSIRSPV